MPTLYFLSDKEPVMGDEFVAAGGFDRLSGNNKAISVCQRSRKMGREKKKQHTDTHTQPGTNKSRLLFFCFFSPEAGVMRRFN